MYAFYTCAPDDAWGRCLRPKISNSSFPSGLPKPGSCRGHPAGGSSGSRAVAHVSRIPSTTAVSCPTTLGGRRNDFALRFYAFYELRAPSLTSLHHFLCSSVAIEQPPPAHSRRTLPVSAAASSGNLRTPCSSEALSFRPDRPLLQQVHWQSHATMASFANSFWSADYAAGKAGAHATAQGIR